MNQNFKVGAELAGRRLDLQLAITTGLSRNQVQRLIESGKVTVNGQPTKASYKLVAGDKVGYKLAEPTTQIATKAPEVKVVYQDDDIVVIDKPAGILVHPHSTSHESTIAEFARSLSTDPDNDRPGIVHRLDRDTSGLLVIARNSKSKTYLQDLFKSRQVKKTYSLLIEGHLKEPEAVINLPIGRSTTSPTLRQVTKGGRPAVTRYRVVKELPGYSLLEADLETGRTHQLRTHFAHLGHPIAGDTMYGHNKRPGGLNRQFLHSAKLAFVGPGGESHHFDSPLPADLAGFLATLEKPV